MKYKMKAVRLSDIIVGDRFRKDLGDIDELANGIKEKGLIQPICIDDKFNLLAGGRRFAACTKLEMETIPCIVREGVDEIDAREVELMENLHRKEMTWKEQANLTTKIHDLYMEKDSNWNQRKTAQLIDQSPMSISRAITLSRAIEQIPELSKSKTADAAFKVVKKAEESLITEELARRQRERISLKTTSTTPIANVLRRADLDYQITDVFLGLTHLKNFHKKFSFIECDPPFGLPVLTDDKRDKSNLHKGDSTAEFVDVPVSDYPVFLSKLTQSLFDVAEDNSWMIFWFAFRWYSEIKDALQISGWNVEPTPGIWHKGKVPYQPYPDKLLNAYHPFLICKKGSPHLMKERHTNAFFWSDEGEKHYHPHQRPIKLMEDLLQIFVPPASKVLVPFLGSGMTLRACYNQGYQGLGFDIDPQYKNFFMVAVEEDTKKMLRKEKGGAF